MVLVIAHRGASGYRPEHTEAAVRLGFALGADAVEPDLVPTRDGILVVRHEPEISGTTDVAAHPEFAGRRRSVEIDGERHSGWFTADFAWEELATLRARERLPELRPESAAHDGEQPILRFRDLLDVLGDVATGSGAPPVLVAEIKHPGVFGALGFDMAELFLAELRSPRSETKGPDEQLPEHRVVVESFELPVLLRLRELGFAGRTVFLSMAPVGVAALPAGIDGVSYDKALLLADGGAALVGSAHATGRLVYTWTLRPENAFLDPRFRSQGGPAERGDWAGEWAAILATGVDGVFADHPDLARLAVGGGA